MTKGKFYSLEELEAMIATAYRHGCDDTIELVIAYLKDGKKKLKDGIAKIKENSHVKH